MKYWIEYWDERYQSWRRFSKEETLEGWGDWHPGFYARKAAGVYLKPWDGSKLALRLVDQEGRFIASWTSGKPTAYAARHDPAVEVKLGKCKYEYEYVLEFTTTEETTMAIAECNIEKPLNVKRTALIERLQENLDAETAKREEAAAKAASFRQKLTDAVKSLTDDELTNLFQRYVVSNPTEGVELIEKWKEAKEFVTRDTEPSHRENELEKYVRVLTMASDDSIEVLPTTPIYHLL